MQTGSAMAMRYYAPFPGGGGDQLRPRGPHALRIGDAERDAAAADLGEHYAAGRLTLDELNERLDAVFSAKTFGQLTRIMADLPGPGRLAMARRARRGAARRRDRRPSPTRTSAWREPWPAAGPPDGTLPGREPHAPPTPADRAGRVAALSLLLIAMLIWLFTALLFASHGFYHPGGRGVPAEPDGCSTGSGCRTTRPGQYQGLGRQAGQAVGTYTDALRYDQVPEVASRARVRRDHRRLGRAGEAQPDLGDRRGRLIRVRHGGRDHPVEQVLRAERDRRLVAGEVGVHRLPGLRLPLGRPRQR